MIFVNEKQMWLIARKKYFKKYLLLYIWPILYTYTKLYTEMVQSQLAVSQACKLTTNPPNLKCWNAQDYIFTGKNWTLVLKNKGINIFFHIRVQSFAVHFLQINRYFRIEEDRICNPGGKSSDREWQPGSDCLSGVKMTSGGMP